MLIIKVWLWG